MTSQQEVGLQAATVGAAVSAVHPEQPSADEAQSQDSKEQPDPTATSCSNQDASIRQPQLEPFMQDRVAPAAMPSQPQVAHDTFTALPSISFLVWRGQKAC